MSLIVINFISKSAEHLKLLGGISTGTADTKFLLWRAHSTSKSLRGAGRKESHFHTMLPFETAQWHEEERYKDSEQTRCDFLHIGKSAKGLSRRQGDSAIADGAAHLRAHRLELGDSSSGIHGRSSQSMILRG